MKPKDLRVCCLSQVEQCRQKIYNTPTSVSLFTPQAAAALARHFNPHVRSENFHKKKKLVCKVLHSSQTLSPFRKNQARALSSWSVIATVAWDNTNRTRCSLAPQPDNPTDLWVHCLQKETVAMSQWNISTQHVSLCSTNIIFFPLSSSDIKTLWSQL